MSKRYELDTTEAISNIEQWMKDTFSTYAAHHGNGHNKKLMVNHIGTWVVTDHNKEVYRGELKGAIDKFNDLKPQPLR